MGFETILEAIFYVGGMIMIFGFDVFLIVCLHYYIKEKKAEYKKDNLEVPSFKR